MTVALPLMRNAPTSLAKNVLFSFALTTGMSATDAAIQWKISGLGTTALKSQTNKCMIS